ncbi:hypothetical protein BD289DRAFT_440630 [Coniella lustricola]|uniref:Zn(2)-C6 fungal-type domain-containing protein n=1 Tax=Coniella lustricola TaxID=2025994 RepID=A0A2T3A0E8_9PEZI|nr:hypothetical protein BD289DRAFT_440630 [Coniella lustricola]
MPRLGYTKSRTGCIKCRQRRVKCDEKRPCTACARHNVPCSLLNNDDSSADAPIRPRRAPKRSQAKRNAATADSKHTEHMSQDLEHLSAAADLDSGFLAGFSFLDDAQIGLDLLWELSSNAADVDGAGLSTQNRDWAMDMELMHHFATEAYLTLPRASEIGHVWRDKAVEMALSNHYLLRLILSFSAFHLAYTRPGWQRKYYYVAAQYQSQGVSHMRAALANLNHENCHALFIAGSLLAVGNLAASAIHAKDVLDPRPTVDDIVDVFVLLKGMATVLHSFEKTIQEGPFTQLFGGNASVTIVASPLANTAPAELSQPRWDDVKQKLRHLRDVLQVRLVDDPALAQTIDQALVSISVYMDEANITSMTVLRFTLSWPISISEAFIKLLREKHPAAIVLLTYYCVIVQGTESRTWYTRGWASKLLLAAEVLVPSPWAALIEWPLQRVGRAVS